MNHIVKMLSVCCAGFLCPARRISIFRICKIQTFYIAKRRTGSLARHNIDICQFYAIWNHTFELLTYGAKRIRQILISYINFFRQTGFCFYLSIVFNKFQVFLFFIIEPPFKMCVKFFLCQFAVSYRCRALIAANRNRNDCLS